MLGQTDLKETLSYLVEQGGRRQDLAHLLEKERETPVVFDLNGQPVTTRKFERFLEPEPAAVTVTTLSGLVDYVQTNPDGLELDKILCHVVSPTKVVLRSKLTGPYLQRPKYVEAEASTLPSIYFGRYMETEAFNIMLLSSFVPSEHRSAILKVTGNVEAGVQAKTADDGVTQEVVLKTGINRKEHSELPSPIVLQPYRTFPEVEQPASAFLLRLKQVQEDGQPVAAFALYEADGGAWRGLAMASIKGYLEAANLGVKVIA